MGRREEAFSPSLVPVKYIAVGEKIKENPKNYRFYL